MSGARPLVRQVIRPNITTLFKSETNCYPKATRSIMTDVKIIHWPVTHNTHTGIKCSHIISPNCTTDERTTESYTSHYASYQKLVYFYVFPSTENVVLCTSMRNFFLCTDHLRITSCACKSSPCLTCARKNDPAQTKTF